MRKTSAVLLGALLLAGCGGGPIDKLVSRLEQSQGVWAARKGPRLSSPAAASMDDVLKEYFGKVRYDGARVEGFKILEQRQVRIKGPLPDRYSVARVRTSMGEKIFVAQYGKPFGWWVVAFDPESTSKPRRR